jgi:HSP20 family protein
MSIIKRNGNQSLFNGFPVFFNDFLTRDLFNWNEQNSSLTNTTIPAVNIREHAENFTVEMAAPGMEKNDFHIELNGNTITISSEKKQEENMDENERYTTREFSYQSFCRVFTLPKDVVDSEKIEAKYENGVLRLTIPKKEEAKQKAPKQIEVM